MINIKKTALVLLSLIISLSGSQFNTLMAKKKDPEKQTKTTKEKTKNKTAKKTELKVFKDRLKMLESNIKWQKLGDLWKIVNHNNRQNLKSLLTQAEEIIKSLQASNFLTIKESGLLIAVFNQRLKEDSGVPPGATCYLVGPDIKKINTKEDLEKRYKLLEDLANNNKISPETYESVKSEIIKDLSNLRLKDISSSSEDENEELIQLLYSLSKGVTK